MTVKTVAVLPDVNLDSDAGQTLALDNSSVGRVVVSASYAPFRPHNSPAIMTVEGHSSIAGMFAGWLRAAPASLVVSIAPRASLTNTGTVGVYNDGSLVISGGAHSKFTNNGVIDTWGGYTTMKLGADINGTGTIVDGNNGYGQVGTKIEFGGAVGAGQKITLDSGTLQLDKPMQFHAVIDHMNTAAAPVYDPTRGLLNGAIVLEHIYAETGSFTSNELILEHQGVKVADLHFSGLGAPGHANLFLTAEAAGSMAVTGYAMPGSFAIHA